MVDSNPVVHRLVDACKRHVNRKVDSLYTGWLTVALELWYAPFRAAPPISAATLLAIHPPMPITDYGRVVREMREQVDVSLRDVADAIDYSPAFLSAV